MPHHFIKESHRAYKKWHMHPTHSAVHWLAFTVVSMFIASAFLRIPSAGNLAADVHSAIAPSFASARQVSMSKGESLGVVPDIIFVKFKPSVGQTKRAAVLSKHGLTEKREFAHIGVKIVKIKQGDTPAAAVERLKSQDADSIEFAEVDEQYSPAFIPNDPEIYTQWHLSKMQVPYAWNKSNGSGVTIAILDSGLPCSNPEFSNCVPGYNFWDNNNDLTDVTGHGTAVAGVAAAVFNNGTQVAGIAGGAKVMPLRISNTTGSTDVAPATDAILYAADHGARVANVSYGGVWMTSTFLSAAHYMRSKGGSVVVSAGNSGLDLATANNPDVIVVAATDNSDQRSTWSNYGSYVDVSAPGQSVITTGWSGGVASGSGTSFSAPAVAGVLALIYSSNPTLTPDQAESILIKSAVDVNAPGYDVYTGWGRVDAGRALLGASVPATDSVVPSAPSAALSQSGAGVTVNWTPSTDNVGVVNYVVARYTLVGNSITNKVEVAFVDSSTTSFTDSSVVSGNTYYYQVISMDAAGNGAASSMKSIAFTQTVTTPSPSSDPFPSPSASTSPSTSPSPSPSPSPTFYTVSISRSGAGSGTVATPDGLISCGGSCSVQYVQGTSVTLTETPGSQSSFGGWSGACSATAASCTFTLNGDASVTATFNSTADTQAPSTPGTLSASATDSTHVALSWGPSTDNVAVTGYRVFRNGAQLTSVTGTSFVDASAVGGTAYSYYVAAYDAAGNVSQPSNLSSVTTPSPVPTLTINTFQVAKRTATTAVITWTTNLPSTGMVSYGLSSLNMPVTVYDNSLSTSHQVTLTSLAKGTKYYYKIQAIGSTTAVTPVSNFRTMSK